MRTKAFSLNFLLSKFYPNSLNFAHAEKHNCSTKRCPLPANIRLDEDVLKMSFVFVFRRRLNQEKYIRLGHKPSIRLQDVFKKSCKSICKYCKDVFKTFSRGIIRLNCLPRSRICLGHTSEKFMVSFLKFQHNSMILVFHFATSFSGCLQRFFLEPGRTSKRELFLQKYIMTLSC